MFPKVIVVSLALAGGLLACSPSKVSDDPGPVAPFPLTAVTLLDGPFLHATELNRQSLLAYEPDRLLANFRKEAGLEPKAEVYGGWESMSLAGHSLGHHLSGCALMWQTTGDERFRERINYIVGELALCQAADSSGYLGAMPEGKTILENEVAKGDIRPQSFNLNGIWAPFYTHHKVLAGLRDAYRLTGNDQALQVAARFADWIGTIIANLTDEQVQVMLECEHGGLQEVLADLSADTGEERYLALARRFHHAAILDSLAMNIDILPFKHGNTQIPKLISQARLYELTGAEEEREAAEFFWSTVVHHHSYVTGGHGNHEYFGRPDELRNRLSDETTETCNVYNMLKLSHHLFLWEPRAEVADFYEQALFNHILSSQNPENGRVVYNLSLEMGGHKDFQDPEWFTCCIGTGMENHSKYGGNIYFHGDDTLYVTQYIASEVNWAAQGLKLTQLTNYPEEQGSSLRISTDQPKTITLALRYPSWATEGMQILINGTAETVDAQPGHFVYLRRTWRDGDEIQLTFPFSLRLEPMPDDSDRIAVCYGPLVLAGELGPVEAINPLEQPDYVPVLMSEARDPAAWLEAVPGEVNTFRTHGAGYPRDFTFRPFYQIHDRNYSVYIDLYTQEKWAARQVVLAQEQARQDSLNALTYDLFEPGNERSETTHRFAGDQSTIVEQRGRRARSAERGGWFAFTMQVRPDAPMTLVLDYWGGYTGSKTFDILIDGERVATQNISNIRDGYFLDIPYPIPPELTAGKTSVEVRFVGHEGHRAGPVFRARML
ncbi:MAG: glycoside hydrolase family 127 protein [Lewinella sp.]|nr:glycoside hydrolase family 127 protein [Lewinella sp.]